MQGNARRTLLADVIELAWPAMLQGLVITVVFFTHRLFLGRYSTEALGSLSIAGPLLWSVFAVFGAFGAGVVAIVGRSIGAGDPMRAQATLRRVLGFAAWIGIAVAVLGWIFRWPIAIGLAGSDKTPAVVRAMAVGYMEIIFAVAPLHFVAMTGITALQASGDTRTPMLMGAGASVVNLVLTWMLVYGHAGAPELGVRGAAIGTAAAFAFECVALLCVLYGRSHRLSLRSPRPPQGTAVASGTGLSGSADSADLPGSAGLPGDGTAVAAVAVTDGRVSPLRAVLRISAPAFGEKIIYHTAYVVFTALIGHLGEVAMAAHQLLLAIESISFIAAEGLGIAAGALVAQKLGAGRPDEAGAAGWIAAGFGAVSLTVVGLVFLVFPEPCIRVFSDDPEVIALGVTCLRVAAIAQPMMAIADALAGALRGAGDTVTPARAAIVGPIVVRISACWILAYPMGLGLVGIWIGSTLDWIVRSAWLARAFRAGRWRTLALPG